MNTQQNPFEIDPRLMAAAEKAQTAAKPRFGIIEEIASLVRLYGLPDASPYPAAELTETALRDKKREGGRIDLVLPKRIGSCVLHRVGVDTLPAFLSGGAV